MKFRAKKKDTHEWINDSETYMHDGDGLWLHDYEDGHVYQVDEETLGLYTGRDDRKGIHIYKDDILKFYYPEPDINDAVCGSSLYVVIWDVNKAGFYVKEIGNDYTDTFEGLTWEVVGNIHDNPELVSKGA